MAMESPYLEPFGTSEPSSSLYSVILATVLLCTILTTLFTIARLIAKKIISSYNSEDCESRKICNQVATDMGIIQTF